MQGILSFLAKVRRSEGGGWTALRFFAARNDDETDNGKGAGKHFKGGSELIPLIFILDS